MPTDDHAHGRVHLHTYPIPWDVMNVSAQQRADYEMLMQESLVPEFAYLGASTSLTRQLPRVLAQRPSSKDQSRALFFLPLSPWPICFVTEPELRRMVRVAWKPGQTEGTWHGVTSRPPPVERVMDAARFSSRGRMRTTGMYPRTATFNSTTHTCTAYERAVRWTFEQPTWQRAPERHLWIYEFPHFLRGALLIEQRAKGCAESLHGKMALGIVLAQEDRLKDWREARAQHHLIVIPFYSPSFFEFDVGRATLEAHKDVLATESSGRGVSCHRFDHGVAGVFSCADDGMNNPNGVRNAVRLATAALGEVLSPASRAEHYNVSFLHRKAALYNRSKFCIVRSLAQPSAA